MFELRGAKSSVEAQVDLRWGIKIPLRDGVHLNGTLYLPRSYTNLSPVILTLTPYVSQMWHEFGLYFAAHDYPFLAVDVRGRGNSDGQFRPLVQEAQDGHDVVEWLSGQPYCDGRVAMWGGSYAGFIQWATAKQSPHGLATITPTASVYPGVDFPNCNNIAEPYIMQWLTLVSGRTSQDKMFFDGVSFWSSQFRKWFESGAPFNEMDTLVGNPSEIFKEWVSHPNQDAYWLKCNPTPEQYGKISIPILSITGFYDGNQQGTLAYYREHQKSVDPKVREQHYLIIGPWDHFGTRTPREEFCGLSIGVEGLIDLQRLHLEWYEWTMKAGKKPEFLRKNVAYYVMGSERWRYADSLENITVGTKVLYLDSRCNPTDLYHSGLLVPAPAQQGGPDHYIYDPRKVDHAKLESTISPGNKTDQRMLHAMGGHHLVYHSAPFEEDVEVAGFFKLRAWMSIDQPDTDICVSIFDVSLDGGAVLLTTDSIRARYRESLREARLISTSEPLLYEFDRFPFIARLIRKGNRLRLVIGPINSIYREKNYNSGGEVALESVNDARVVTVKLFHDSLFPTALHVPVGEHEARDQSF